MLTEDEIFLAIDNVPITQKYVVGVGRAIERSVLAKLAAARIPEQNAGSVQPYVQAGAPGAPGATDAERAAWLADKIGALGDYAKEAAAMLRRWPAGTHDDSAWVAQVVSSGPHNFQLLQWRSADISLSTPIGTKLYTAPGVAEPDDSRRDRIGQACAEVFGWRKCEFCGCNTNAMARACCEKGRAADGVAPKAQPSELHAILEFLYGAAPLDGCWFGDGCQPTGQGRYWWRSRLRAALAASGVDLPDGGQQ